jgi:hypothetical protein
VVPSFFYPFLSGYTRDMVGFTFFAARDFMLARTFIRNCVQGLAARQAKILFISFVTVYKVLRATPQSSGLADSVSARKNSFTPP